MSIRVFIVDDSKVARDAVRRALEGSDLEVVGEAENGREAVLLYAPLRPHVVVMDLVMPEMNGIDAAKEIIQTDPGARILAVTGLSQASVIEEIQAAGFISVVLKPFDPRMLVAEIRRAAGY